MDEKETCGTNFASRCRMKGRLPLFLWLAVASNRKRRSLFVCKKSVSNSNIFYFQNQQERRLVEWRNEKHDAAQNEHFINVLSPYLLI